MADDDAEPEGPSTPPGGKKKKGFTPTKVQIDIGIAGLIVAILVLKKMQASSAATTTASTTATTSGAIDPNTGIPYAAEVNTGGSAQGAGSYYGSNLSPQDVANLNSQFAGIGSEISTLQSQLSGLSSPVSASASTTSVAPTNQSSISTSPNQVDISGTSYDVLGTLGPSGSLAGYTGKGVTGGAPVFFQNAGGAPTQGAGAEKPGSVVLTPSSYRSQEA
jgi:hypothetical protein